jgi:hypothetical protein
MARVSAAASATPPTILALFRPENATSRCALHGVRCSPNRKLVELDLRPHVSQLGTLPTQLGLLTTLEVLEFGGSSVLSGTLPTELGSLAALRRLVTWSPRLSGTLPKIGGPSMHAIRVTKTRLSGTLPASHNGVCIWPNPGAPAVSRRGFGSSACHRETELHVGRNRLSGTLPAALPSTAVGLLDVSSNQLSGTLPTCLAHAHRLRLASNSFSGTLPIAVQTSPAIWDEDLTATRVTTRDATRDTASTSASDDGRGSAAGGEWRSPWHQANAQLDLRREPATWGWGPLAKAAAANDTAALAAALAPSAHPATHPDEVGLDGRTALHAALLYGDYDEAVTLLLRAGADPSRAAPYAGTPLRYADRYERVRSASVLRTVLRGGMEARSSDRSGTVVPRAGGARSERNRLPHARSESSRLTPPLTTTTTTTTTAPLPRWSQAQMPRRPPLPQAQRGHSGPLAPTVCCLHSCHGRGVCRDGVCECDEPHRAMPLDCAPPPNISRHHARRHARHATHATADTGTTGAATTHSADAATATTVSTATTATATADADATEAGVAGCPFGRRHGIFVGSDGFKVSRMLPSLTFDIYRRANECNSTLITTLEYALPPSYTLRHLPPYACTLSPNVCALLMVCASSVRSIVCASAAPRPTASTHRSTRTSYAS